MLIGNFRSAADREAKLKSQAEYLALQIQNQATLEKRVKDYQNPNKPPPVPPQYKTTAELEIDGIKQEKDAKDNLASLSANLDFNTIMTVVEDLRSRGQDALVKFNRNFPLIKKKLTEDINPKLLNAEVIITKIDEIFQKIDSSFGLNQGGYKSEDIYSREPLELINKIPYREAFIGGEGGEVNLDYYKLFALGIQTAGTVLEIDSADTQRIEVIQSFLVQLGRALPTLGELDDIKTLPAVERNELIKILSKILTEGLLPTRQTWESLFSSIGEKIKVLSEANPIPADNYSNQVRDEEYQEALERDQAAEVPDEEVEQIVLSTAHIPQNEVLERRNLRSEQLEEPESSIFLPRAGVSRTLRIPTRERYPDAPPNPFSEEGSEEGSEEAPQPAIAVERGERGRLSGYQSALLLQPLRQRNNRPADPYIAAIADKLVQQLFFVERLVNNVTGRTYKQLSDFKKKLETIFVETNVSANKALSLPYQQAITSTLNQDTINELQRLKPSEFRQYFGQMRVESNQLLNAIGVLIRRYGEDAPEAIRERLNQLAQDFIYNQEELRTIATNIRLSIDQKEEAERLAEENEARLREELANNSATKLTEIFRLNAKRRIERREREQKEAEELEAERAKQERRQGLNQFLAIKPRIKEDRNNAVGQYLAQGFSQFPINALKHKLFQGVYALKGITEKEYGKQLKGLTEEERRDIITRDLINSVIEKREGQIIEGSYNPTEAKFPENFVQTTLGRQQNQFGFGVKGFKGRKIKVGRGLSVASEEKPRYREFGKYRIHNHLLDENVIHLKYPSLANIPSLKPVSVSDNYIELISGLLDTGDLDHRKLNKLTDKEDEHFRKIVKASGLSEQLRIEPKKDDKEEEDYHRLTLLKGEFEAGNNNEKLIKELRGLVVKFINLGRIPRKGGLNFLMTLSV